MAVAERELDREDLEAAEQPLYAKRLKIYPQRIHGIFRRIKWAALVVLLAIYYVAPWLRWDRGPGAPDQAILVDTPGRRAYFFWIEIWPQEVYYLTGLLILGAICLFLATSLAGRVWCGFTCPQTVWTDLYMWVERLIEGDRNRRIKLDQAPLSAAKVARKIAKHAAWLVIAFLTGGAWIMYFNDAPTVLAEIFTGRAGATVYGFVGLFTATTYLLAGWAREQVCIYMCPWPRFQAAMFDEHSLLVTYESWRGEPRAKAKAGQSHEGRGHCIDCGLCVRVCPTGIDIRDGQQLACIGCGLCVDACNSVMTKLGWPRELITYDSLSNQMARETKKPTRLRLVRARTVIYAGLMVVVTAALLIMLSTRATLNLTVQPDRAPLFVRLSDGRIQNAYTVKIINKDRAPRQFRIAVDGVEGAEATVIGYESAGPNAELPVTGDNVGTFRVVVRAPDDARRDSPTSLDFHIRDIASGESDDYRTAFNGP